MSQQVRICVFIDFILYILVFLSSFNLLSLIYIFENNFSAGRCQSTVDGRIVWTAWKWYRFGTIIRSRVAAVSFSYACIRAGVLRQKLLRKITKFWFLTFRITPTSSNRQFSPSESSNYTSLPTVPRLPAFHQVSNSFHYMDDPPSYEDAIRMSSN